jgi:hypothetical protein
VAAERSRKAKRVDRLRMDRPSGDELVDRGLRAASTRIVVAAGATSKGQLPTRTAVALADQLGTTVVDLPGDHGGFLSFPEQFGRVLDQVLTERT